MNIQRLCALVETALNSDDSIAEWREGGLHLTAAWEAASGRVGQTPASAEEMIVATMFGQFHISAEPGGAPFVCLGDAVQPGQCVALLEAMKAFIPVAARQAGRIVEILVEHGAEVRLGQPLFRIA